MPGAVNVAIRWTRPGAGSPPVITSPSSLVTGTVNTLYPTTTFTATGTAPITWSIFSGTLPAGMTFSSGGVLSGTPTVTFSGSITFRATNAFGFADRPLTLTINAASVVPNTMTLALPTGTATNYPYQFGRVFKQGEIANYPQVLIDGVTQTTQADVKNRWPDGSVKFAIISLIVPSLNTSLKKLTFQNQASGNNTPETKANMLANYDFEATIVATVATTGISGTPLTGAPVSARAMLNATSDATLASNTAAFSPNFNYWTQGPICTTVVLADHTGKAFDFGTTADKALRPIFLVQFWPTLSLYRVRYIVEQSDVLKLKNETYDVGLKIGNASPSVLFTQASVPQVYATRWTKQFWCSTGPTALLNEVHNIGYMASTYAISNYDPSISITAGAVSSFIASLPTATHNLYDQGPWPKYMGQAGGRPDLGLYPSWHIAALYSGNGSLISGVLNTTDLLANYPVQLRTGDSRDTTYTPNTDPSTFSDRIFDTANSFNAFGRVITKDSHPGQFINQINNIYVPARDKFTFIGYSGTSIETNTNGWSADGQHQPDPNYIAYLITGDFWYLEQLQFWASYGLFLANPGTGVLYGGRGSNDAIIAENTRGNSWVLRTRARVGFISVDSSPEKSYFNKVTEQALRKFEGTAIGSSPGGLPPSGGIGDGIRNYWATNYPAMTSNPLKFYWRGADSVGNVTGAGFDYTKVHSVEAPWQTGMFTAVMAHVKELGYTASEFVSFYSQNAISMATNGVTDQRHLADYYLPQLDATNVPFQTWGAVTDINLKATPSPWVSDWESALGDTNSGTTYWMMSAIAMVAAETNGASAWSWVNTNGYSLSASDGKFAANPKFAIKPR